MFPEFSLDPPSPPPERPVPPEMQSQVEEMLRRRLDPEEHSRLERLLLQRLKERQPELTGMLQEEGFVTGFRENESPRFGVTGQRPRQRLDCVCLQHRFPSAATRPASPHGRWRPEPKAPVKPDALQTLARAGYLQIGPPASIHPGLPRRSQFMVEMEVRYADLPKPPQPMPNGWAALPYLFDLR